MYSERTLILVTLSPLLLNIQTITPLKIKHPHNFNIIQMTSWKNIKQENLRLLKHFIMCLLL